MEQQNEKELQTAHTEEVEQAEEANDILDIEKMQAEIIEKVREEFRQENEDLRAQIASLNDKISKRVIAVKKASKDTTVDNVKKDLEEWTARVTGNLKF